MIDRDQRLNILMMMFPLAKFDYLRERVLECNYDEDIEDLIESLVEDQTYPQKEVTRGNDESDREFRIEPFDVADFLKEYMYDPLKHFAGLNRDMHHKALTLDYLKKRFKPIREDYIKTVLLRANFNLMEAADALRNPPLTEISSLDRPSGDLPDDLDATNWPINFKREVQFFEHKSEVMEYLEIVKKMKEASIEQKTNLSCECCYDDDVLAEEALACQGGHIFCIFCVIKHVEAQDNKPDLFKCIFFQFCSYRFSEELLQKCFKPAKLAEINNNWQKELLRRAEIPGLESCPFCDYAAIADPDDLVFICHKCTIKSCRQCRRAYHSPLDCEGARNPPAPASVRNPPVEQTTLKRPHYSGSYASDLASGSSSPALTRNTQPLPAQINRPSAVYSTAQNGAIPKQTLRSNAAPVSYGSGLVQAPRRGQAPKTVTNHTYPGHQQGANAYGYGSEGSGNYYNANRGRTGHYYAYDRNRGGFAQAPRTYANSYYSDYSDSDDD